MYRTKMNQKQNNSALRVHVPSFWRYIVPEDDVRRLKYVVIYVYMLMVHLSADRRYSIVFS